MTFLKLALVVVAVTFLAGHVAPSVDDNNRYLKVTPLRDGVRLAYTVFFGEIPGASERRAIDTNRDGRIDDAEAKQFAAKLGAQVAASLTVEIDATPQRVQWTTVSPGMGSDAVAAGSFSIDFVAFFCDEAAAAHRVQLRDQFRIPRPGETELKVEDSPGVTIERAKIGGADDPTHNFRFAGPGGPLADDGLVLFYRTTAQTPMATGCASSTPAAGEAKKLPAWAMVGIAIGVCLVVALIAYLKLIK